MDAQILKVEPTCSAQNTQFPPEFLALRLVPESHLHRVLHPTCPRYWAPLLLGYAMATAGDRYAGTQIYTQQLACPRSRFPSRPCSGDSHPQLTIGVSSFSVVLHGCPNSGVEVFEKDFKYILGCVVGICYLYAYIDIWINRQGLP